MTGDVLDAVDGHGDAVLVARVLDGDRDAFAAVYDRYADRLYDFAHSMLRNSEDASDAVADAFVTFAEKLPQLREPDRLRPWLYSIVRNQCLGRIRARDRIAFGGDEQMVEMADPGLAPDELVATSALQQLVWDAANGLAERDRALLDLHLRQGLDGADLGEAMGVSASNAYVMMNRLRGQLDRSLGALLVAKTGRADCSELDGTLSNWDGEFSPLVRKRVARHVDGCPKCTVRKAAMASPLALFAGVSAFAAPMGLRERVLASVTLEPGRVSQSAPTGGNARLRWAIMGTTAAVIIALVVLLVPGRLADGTQPKPAESPTASVVTSEPAPVPTAPPPRVNPQPDPGDDNDSKDEDDGEDSADDDREDGDEEPEDPADPPREPPVVRADPVGGIGIAEEDQGGNPIP